MCEATSNGQQSRREVTAFTPGPWKVIYSPKLQVCDVAETWTIADLDWDYLADDIPADDAGAMDATDEANARLIAASPSMHAVLSRLVAMCDAGYDMRDGDGAMHEVSIPLINDARALLAQIGDAAIIARSIEAGLVKHTPAPSPVPNPAALADLYAACKELAVLAEEHAARHLGDRNAGALVERIRSAIRKAEGVER